jgi:hypothetical protein
MRRAPFKPWIVLIPSCRSRRDAPNATASNTTATAPSPYAALNTATGRVHGKTAARHTSREFVAFLQDLSGHKTQVVREFLQQHPRVRFHFTPTYSSWLNQVEIWFAKIEREVIARGIFTSVSDLARKLRRYINAYSANARPIQ